MAMEYIDATIVIDSKLIAFVLLYSKIIGKRGKPICKRIHRPKSSQHSGIPGILYGNLSLLVILQRISINQRSAIPKRPTPIFLIFMFYLGPLFFSNMFIS